MALDELQVCGFSIRSIQSHEQETGQEDQVDTGLKIKQEVRRTRTEPGQNRHLTLSGPDIVQWEVTVGWPGPA